MSRGLPHQFTRHNVGESEIPCRVPRAVSFTLECRSEASSFVSNSEPAGPTRQMQYGSDVPASQVSVLRSPCALCTRIEPVEPTFTLSSSTFCGILTSGGDGDGDNSGDGDGDGDNSGDGDGELAVFGYGGSGTVTLIELYSLVRRVAL